MRVDPKPPDDEVWKQQNQTNHWVLLMHKIAYEQFSEQKHECICLFFRCVLASLYESLLDRGSVIPWVRGSVGPLTFKWNRRKRRFQPARRNVLPGWACSLLRSRRNCNYRMFCSHNSRFRFVALSHFHSKVLHKTHRFDGWVGMAAKSSKQRRIDQVVSFIRNLQVDVHIVGPATV